MEDKTMNGTSRRDALMLAAKAALGATAVTFSGPLPAFAGEDDTFSENEVVKAVADFFGVTTEAAAKVVEKIFADLGRPNAYIKGEEASGAIGVGLRYGEGTMVRKGYRNMKVHWQGPSIGFDIGANASKCFTLVYGIRRQEEIFQRFPGVEGSYYFIAGIGVNYQRTGRISLAPMRTGVGLRAGVNAGYLHYTREQEWFPL
ncbi:MAG: DUF1134 domain-containing protein [Alphaproteobacteria bacterium]|nr:DUF1134 domain-containing protein [Alphaproteobacteria bacterium]